MLSSIGLWVSLGLAILGASNPFCIIFFPSFQFLFLCISCFYFFLFLHLVLMISCCRIELNGWCKFFCRIKSIISSLKNIWKFIVIIEFLGLVFLFPNLDCQTFFLEKNIKFLLFFRAWEWASIELITLASDHKNILVHKKNYPIAFALDLVRHFSDLLAH